jgi:predicted HTH transcriptional regulator
MNKEKQTIEWKENWRDEYIKWLCGFANAYGGTLVIGKNDDIDVRCACRSEGCMNAEVAGIIRKFRAVRFIYSSRRN